MSSSKKNIFVTAIIILLILVGVWFYYNQESKYKAPVLQVSSQDGTLAKGFPAELIMFKDAKVTYSGLYTKRDVGESYQIAAATFQTVESLTGVVDAYRSYAKDKNATFSQMIKGNLVRINITSTKQVSVSISDDNKMRTVTVTVNLTK